MLHTYILITIALFFFFNDTATTEIYTLSLHDALPISMPEPIDAAAITQGREVGRHSAEGLVDWTTPISRSEEHTSELQSRLHLVCRLLLEKKKKKKQHISHTKNKKTQPKTSDAHSTHQ